MAQIKRHGETIKSLLGQNIRLYREAIGFSQEQLAEKAGISAPFLGSLERGEKWPGVDTLAGIALGLNVNTYDLFKPENIISKDINRLTEKMLKEIQASVKETVKGINQSIIENSEQKK
jgi:transcriptional regulator with XRE-family HTH domain